MNENVLYSESKTERRLANELRDAAVDKIEAIGRPVAAQRLGLQPGGVDALLWEPKWDVATAIRAAEALGILRGIGHGLVR